MDIRFDPALPIVWRDPHTLQIGIDRPAVVLSGLTARHERVVAAIAAGEGSSGLGHLVQRTGGQDRDVGALVERLAPALARDATEADARRDVPVVEVAGSCGLASEIAELLASEGVAVLRVDSETAGLRDDVALGVAVSRFVHDPGVSAAWMRRDLPHLAVVAGDRGTRIGPFVVPGETACAHCLDLHRSDVDPAWGVIAGQLWRRAPAAMPRVGLREGAVRAVRRILRRQDPALVAADTGADALMETLDYATGAVTTTTSRLHPACGCAALPRSDSGDDRSGLGPGPGGSTTGGGASGLG